MCLSPVAFYPCARWLTNFSPYSLFGRGIYIRFSSLLRNASSMSQGKFVAAKTITILPWSSLKYKNQILLILCSQNKIMLTADDISLFYQINGLAALDILKDHSAFKKGLLGTANEGTTIHWNIDNYSLDTVSYTRRIGSSKQHANSNIFNTQLCLYNFWQQPYLFELIPSIWTKSSDLTLLDASCSDSEPLLEHRESISSINIVLGA